MAAALLSPKGMSLRWCVGHDGSTVAVRTSEEPVPLMRWRLYDGTECLIAAVEGIFEVCLVRHDTVVQVKRFSMPGPAFDMARAWRHDAELARSGAAHSYLAHSFPMSPEEGQ
jgi:hypothetical protein